MTNTLDNSLLVESPPRCPVCDHPHRRRLGRIRYGDNALVADQDASDLARRLGTIHLVACRRCGFQWTDPRYGMNAVIDLYRRNTKRHWEADGRYWAKYVDTARLAMTTPGSVLDVGCYAGDFLALLGIDWTRYGIEPIPNAAAIARKHGIDIHEGTIEDAEYSPGSFDLITLWDVLEHLPEPSRSFGKLAGWLKPGGAILFETGNADCAFARWMGSDWWYVALLEHCGFHTPRSAQWLAENNGLLLERVIPTVHHVMTPRQMAKQMAKAAVYRGISRIESTPFGRFMPSPGCRILRKHAPCVLMRDHFLAVLRRPI